MSLILNTIVLQLYRPIIKRNTSLITDVYKRQISRSAESRRSSSWEGRREVPSENQRRDEQNQPTTSDSNRGNESPQ